MISYTLIRSDRRTLAIHILPDACVEVRAPLHCSASTIDTFVREKEPWIINKLALARERQAQKQPWELHVGDTLPYQGRELPVCPSSDGRLRFDHTAFYIPQTLLSGNEYTGILKMSLTELYKQITLPLARERVPLYAATLGVRPMAVKVSTAARRWGSCSGKNSLNFSWMLAAADPSALDYVVVHELCHIWEHNHSDAFWRLVEGVLPDYKQRQALLRHTEQRLQSGKK